MEAVKKFVVKKSIMKTLDLQEFGQLGKGKALKIDLRGDSAHRKRESCDSKVKKTQKISIQRPLIIVPASTTKNCNNQNTS